jgi:hypothetical protein
VHTQLLLEPVALVGREFLQLVDKILLLVVLLLLEVVRLLFLVVVVVVVLVAQGQELERQAKDSLVVTVVATVVAVAAVLEPLVVQ